MLATISPVCCFVCFSFVLFFGIACSWACINAVSCKQSLRPIMALSYAILLEAKCFSRVLPVDCFPSLFFLVSDCVCGETLRMSFGMRYGKGFLSIGR